MPTCHEDYRSMSWTPKSGATRVFLVDGVSDANLVAGVVNPAAIPSQGSYYPLDSKLEAKTITISQNGGPMAWRVDVSYGVKEDEPEQDESAYLVTWRFEEAITTEPADTDADGNPITNSAGFPSSSPPTNEFTDDWMTARRWQTSFDIATVHDYRNSVNADDITIPGYGKVPKLCARLASVYPEKEWTAATVIMPVIYRFHIRTPSFASYQERAGVVSPHDYRILDSGYMGWYSDSGTAKHGRFVDGDGKEYLEEIRLDGTGRPKGPDFLQAKVTASKKDPIAAGSRAGLLATDIGEFATWLRWKKCRRLPFNSLYLFSR